MVLYESNKIFDGSHPLHNWESSIPLKLFKVEVADWTPDMKLRYYGLSPEAAKRFDPESYTEKVNEYFGPEYTGIMDLGSEVYLWLAETMMENQGLYFTPCHYVELAKKIGMDDAFLDILEDPENFWILGAHNIFYWILLRIELARGKFCQLCYYQGQMHFVRNLEYQNAIRLEDPELQYEVATVDIHV